jgi:probable F420-dependent oxidoreductase
VKFIYLYPETYGSSGYMLDSGPLLPVVAAAERAGFHAYALTDHPIPGSRWLENGGHQTLEPLVALSAVAAVTERIRLHTHIAVAPYRNPFLLAKEAATVDIISGGRMTLALGAGYQKSEFFALGVDFEERNALFDEVLEVLPLAWSGRPVSYKGRHFDAREVIALPRPVQNPIPVWIGGNSRRSRRRVIEWGQGWAPFRTDPQLANTARTLVLDTLDKLADQIKELEDEASAAGRREPIDVVWSYHDRSITDPTVEPDRHREAFAEYERAGVTWLSIPVAIREPSATLDFIEAFGSTYLP